MGCKIWCGEGTTGKTRLYKGVSSRRTRRPSVFSQKEKTVATRPFQTWGIRKVLRTQPCFKKMLSWNVKSQWIKDPYQPPVWEIRKRRRSAVIARPRKHSYSSSMQKQVAPRVKNIATHVMFVVNHLAVRILWPHTEEFIPGTSLLSVSSAAVPSDSQETWRVTD